MLALNTMHFVSKMMNSAFEMMNSARYVAQLAVWGYGLPAEVAAVSHSMPIDRAVLL